MKRSITVITICMLTLLVILCVGCTNDDKVSTKEFLGDELYNASYAYTPGDDVVHIISIMSKRDITKAIDVQLESEGGSFDLDYSLENGEYDYEEYHLYRVALTFSNINFEDESINIRNVDIYFENDEKIELKLDKCEIVEINKEYNVQHVNINGTPLKLPSDMTAIPLELSADENVKITNIYLTNESLTLGNYSDGEGNITEEFYDVFLVKNGDIKYWSADLGIENTELSQYKNYGTSIIIEYEYDGNVYYTIPAIPRTVYNPFDVGYDGIERYFQKLQENK